MVDVAFDLNQEIIVIQSKLDEPFQIVIEKFIQKTLINPDSAYFIANEKTIHYQQTIESYMNDLDKKNKKIIVSVNFFEQTEQDKDQIITQSKDIICPKCKESCRYTIENYQIKLFDCINNHTTTRIKFKDFYITQETPEIICDQCKFNNKDNSQNNELFSCLTCQQNICSACRSTHDSNHNIIKYDMKNYICPKHNEIFFKFCVDCHSNICYLCEDEHVKHKAISLSDLKPNFEQSKTKLDEIKIEIDRLSKQIKEIINQLNGFVEAINSYYNINRNIITNYDVKKGIIKFYKI